MSAAKKKIVIAVTGATKTGKSELCAYLGRSSPVIDVDYLAHTIYKKGTSLYRILRKKYGTVIIKKDGEINRRILGEIVFGDRRDYWDFTCLVYPALIKKLKKEIQKTPGSAVIVDMAILFESGFYTRADKIILVKTSAGEWKKRISEVSDRRYFEKIRKYQDFFPYSKKIALSDFIIYNNGSKEDLYKKADKIMGKILKGDLWTRKNRKRP
jgi:dephospho-CoA kinase